MITRAELTALTKNYQNIMQNADVGCSQDQLNKFLGLITSLYQYVGHNYKPANHLFLFLKKIIQNARINADFKLANYFQNAAVLREGEQLVKALDKDNPLSKRAKKYLISGIAAMVFGILVLPALILGGLLLKKAFQLRKAPQGLALDFANAIPGLAEKTHYGDIHETASRKLKKAEVKLAILKKRRAPNPAQKIERNTALAYYTERVSYLKVCIQLLKRGSKAELAAPNWREGFITQANHLAYKPDKSSLDRWNANYGMGIAVNSNNNGKDVISFFSPAYNHTEHAQKVESTLRKRQSLAN